MPEGREIPQSLMDANGVEIKRGGFGRLSEKGRQESPVAEVKTFPNLRFAIIDLPQSDTEHIVAQTTETPKPILMLLKRDWIIMEK